MAWRIYSFLCPCQKTDITIDSYWLSMTIVFLPSSRPETVHKTFTLYIYRFFKDTFRAMNTEASIPVKG